MNFNQVDKAISSWMHKYGLTLLRYSLAIIFIWFGMLKIIGYSPIADLVTRTVYWVDPSWFVPFLGAWEVVIGICFLIKPLVRLGILLLAPQMIGTFLPLILLSGITFQNSNILTPSIEGHYIIKNLIIIAAAIVIGSHVRDKD